MKAPRRKARWQSVFLRSMAENSVSVGNRDKSFRMAVLSGDGDTRRI